jgi:hypothetical protein
MNEYKININKNEKQKLVLGAFRSNGDSNASNDTENTSNINNITSNSDSEFKLDSLINSLGDTPNNTDEASNNTDTSDKEFSLEPLQSENTDIKLEEESIQEDAESSNNPRPIIVFTDEDGNEVDANNISIDQIIDDSESNGDHNPFLINSGKPKRKRKLTTDERFDPNILSIQGGYANFKANLDAYIQWTKDHPKDSEPFTFLFTGLPGTGKTQLGRHIAEVLHRPLIVKRMSDIMSCYVGESEKNVAAAFEEAAEKKGVLMIDEADSLFTSRQSAHTSWEVSLTNEVLSQMEDFESVFICTTNLLNNFDSAAMRRFDWKVSFLPSTPDQRVLLYSAYFNNNQPPSDAIKNVLIDARFNGLCPGDFKAVWRKLRFIDNKTAKDIMSALLTELRYKQKPSNNGL